MSDRRVYIVDDDEAVRDSLSVLLESKVYAVRSFASAPEFLKAAPSLRPGCLIVDIRMPEMDGLELQQRLTNHHLLNFPLIRHHRSRRRPTGGAGDEGGRRRFHRKAVRRGSNSEQPGGGTVAAEYAGRGSSESEVNREARAALAT